MFEKSKEVDGRLRKIFDEVSRKYPDLSAVIPSQTVIEKVGNITLFTFTFKSNLVVVQFSYNTINQIVSEVFNSSIPESVDSVFF